MLETIHCKNYGELSEKAAQIVLKKIGEPRQVSLVLSGGTSVKGLLESLGNSGKIFSNVNAFMADERLVPPDSSESNFRQAEALFFSKAQGIHAHAFGTNKGIEEYNRAFQAVTKGVPDIAVLGVGEDGHIASLFPHHEALESNENGFIAVHNAPKKPAERISLSPKAIASAREVLLLFASESKKEAFEKFSAEKVSAKDCPAKIALAAEKVSALTAFGGSDGG